MISLRIKKMEEGPIIVFSKKEPTKEHKILRNNSLIHQTDFGTKWFVNWVQGLAVNKN